MEYRIISVRVGDAERKMNEMEKEGWNVVSVCNDLTKIIMRTHLLITFSKKR